MRLSAASLGAMAITATALSLALVVIPSASAQGSMFPNATVCGVVLNETGQPAPFVKVSAAYLGGHSGPYPMAVTDVGGHYCLLDVPGGPNMITADDPAKGYPSLLSSLYSTTKQPTVTTVPSDGTRVHVDVRIPYKAAILHVQLTDADTGQPVRSMMYKLSLKSDPNSYLRGSGSSTEPLLVPPRRDVYLTVTGAAYQPATSPNQYHLLLGPPGGGIDTSVPNLQPATGVTPPQLLLNLASGAVYTLAVTLHRVP